MPTSSLKQVHAVAGILWRKERLLCCQRPAGKVLAFYWEFPGGKVEAGETTAQALERELKEELNVHIRAYQPWQIVQFTYEKEGLLVNLHVFHVTEFEGEPVAQEGQAIQWVDYREASKLPFLPADQGLLPALLPPTF